MKEAALICLVVLVGAALLGYLTNSYITLTEENRELRKALEQVEADLARCQQTSQDLLERCDPEELNTLRTENSQLREQLDPFWQEQARIHLQRELALRELRTYILWGIAAGIILLVASGAVYRLCRR